MKNLSKFFIVFLVLITVVSISSISTADCTSDIVSSDYEDTALNDGDTYQLIVKNVNMYYADRTKLVVKVLNDAGKPVKNVAVHVKINGKTHKLLTNNKGLADLALNLNPKKYTVVSTIPDTDVKTKSTYTVNKWKKSLTSFTVNNMAKAFKTAKPFRVLLKHNNVPALVKQ